MKSLVVYDSAYGNTQKIAEEIARSLNGKAIFVNDFHKQMLNGVELLIVGSPINGWRPLPKINEFLADFSENELKGIKATSFDTRLRMFFHGDAKNKIAKALKSTGASIIAEPEAFYVKGTEGPLFDGELERARGWAKELLK